jgi:hypothetical protein
MGMTLGKTPRALWCLLPVKKQQASMEMRVRSSTQLDSKPAGAQSTVSWGGGGGVPYLVDGPVYGFYGGVVGDVVSAFGIWTTDSPSAPPPPAPNPTGMVRSKMFGTSSATDDAWDDHPTFAGNTQSAEQLWGYDIVVGSSMSTLLYMTIFYADARVNSTGMSRRNEEVLTDGLLSEPKSHCFV